MGQVKYFVIAVSLSLSAAVASGQSHRASIADQAASATKQAKVIICPGQ